MKAYLSFIKLRFNVNLQYRFAAIAGIMTQFFWGAMYIMIYEAYFRANIETPMDWMSLVSYIWLMQSLFIIISFAYNDSEINNAIVTGQVSYEFVRPLNIYWYWFSKLFATKVSRATMRFWPIMLVAIFLPVKYRLGLPASFVSFILFLITLILGLILSLGIVMLIYSLMFYTTSSRGLFSVYALIADFFAGGVIPIPFMPAILQNIAYALPFRLIMDLPFRLYVGNISVSEGLQSLFLQLIWIVIIITLGNILMKQVTKKLVLQGG